MIIVRLSGGMGNQMFQYALGRALALRNKTGLKLDISFFDLALRNATKRNYDLDVFNIQAEIANDFDIPFVFRLRKSKVVFYLTSILKKVKKTKGQEKGFDFDPKILSVGSNVYLDGYWQSPKYFEGFENVIRGDFTLKNPPAQNIQILAEDISKTNSLCVHVRRGDYVGNKFYEVVNKEYYQKAFEYISSKREIDKIYVFSDDINWCKENLSFPKETIFVEDECRGERAEGHMFLMSLAKNFIIPNSTFSWWGAWLSNHKDKIVICPKQWFGDVKITTPDLIPEDWVRM